MMGERKTRNENEKDRQTDTLFIAQAGLSREAKTGHSSPIFIQMPQESLRFLYTLIPLLYTILTRPVPILSIESREIVMDVIFIVLTIGFFAVSWKFIDGCERL